MMGAALDLRGTVEGFYGPPWSHSDRMAHLEFSAEVGLNTYVYAPKDDPHHRARWREPYPAAELARLSALAALAARLGLRFVYAISPGLTMGFTLEADHRALVTKATQLADAGVEEFALFFDDVPAELARPEERERWPGAGGSGAAHGETCSRFVTGFLEPHGLRRPLLVCPTDYAGTESTPYRRDFAGTAPPDALIAWTGRDVVVGSVTRDEIDRAAASYERRLVLWDNFPVNDFAPGRLFLGSLTGRTGDLAGSPLAGVLANPMELAAPSRIPLVSVADWAADPARYDPAASAARALPLVAGEGAGDLAPLVRVNSSWPPSAPQDADLIAAVDGALAGEPAMLVSRLEDLARGCRAAGRPQWLTGPLRPWLEAGAAMAEAGLAAVRLLSATSSPVPPGTPLRQAAHDALTIAEGHYADVLRSVIPPFVREVLDRTAGPAAPRADGRPRALLLTGANRTAGDEVITGLLESEGFTVLDGTAEPADLIVVSRGAEAQAIAEVARAGVPVLAWHGFVALGMAHAENVLVARDRLRIADPGHPMAAGLDGVAQIYCGRSSMTVADVGPEAHVVARPTDDLRAALFHYPVGARLADGTAAPAPRIGVCLAAEGMAPWLLAPAGRAMMRAAVSYAGSLAGFPPPPR
jgi:hypothetical protein